MGSHSFCANLTHFEVGSHSSEAADLDRSAHVISLPGPLPLNHTVSDGKLGRALE